MVSLFILSRKHWWNASSGLPLIAQSCFSTGTKQVLPAIDRGRREGGKTIAVVQVQSENPLTTEFSLITRKKLPTHEGTVHDRAASDSDIVVKEPRDRWRDMDIGTVEIQTQASALLQPKRV